MILFLLILLTQPAEEATILLLRYMSISALILAVARLCRRRRVLDTATLPLAVVMGLMRHSRRRVLDTANLPFAVELGLMLISAHLLAVPLGIMLFISNLSKPVALGLVLNISAHTLAEALGLMLFISALPLAKALGLLRRCRRSSVLEPATLPLAVVLDLLRHCSRKNVLDTARVSKRVHSSSLILLTEHTIKETAILLRRYICISDIPLTVALRLMRHCRSRSIFDTVTLSFAVALGLVLSIFTILLAIEFGLVLSNSAISLAVALRLLLLISAPPLAVALRLLRHYRRRSVLDPATFPFAVALGVSLVISTLHKANALGLMLRISTLPLAIGLRLMRHCRRRSLLNSAGVSRDMSSIRIYTTRLLLHTLIFLFLLIILTEHKEGTILPLFCI